MRDLGRTRICIVSEAIDGPQSLCPTAMATGLIARILAEIGVEVTVLLPSRPPADLPLTEWISRFDQLGIRLECLYLPDLYATFRSWLVFQQLRERNFDTVLFLDRGAVGYWSIRAQNQGIEFDKTRLFLVVADPTEFGFREKWMDPDHPRFLMTLEMERFLVQEAENILTMSDGLATYIGRLGSKTDPVSVPQALPLSILSAMTGMAGTRARDSSDVQLGQLPAVVSLGFLGLADEASGVRKVAELVAATWYTPAPLVAEFLAIGGTGLLATGEDGYSLIAVALRGWPGRIELRPCMSLEEFAADVAAQQMIVVRGRCAGFDVVTEWIARAAGHSFVDMAADLKSGAGTLVGAPLGIQSVDAFVESVEAARQLMPDALALAGAYQTKGKNAADDFRRLIVGSRSAPAKPNNMGGATPKVSVCISHFNRPDLLEQALQSLRTQTYTNVEVVIYDDASPSETTQRYLDSLKGEFARRGWLLLRGDRDRWPAAGRNEAARHASGEYLLFMDDDNCARPREIETMVAVAQRTGADAVTCFSHLFEGEAYPQQSEVVSSFSIGSMPMGHGVALGSIWNIFGDTNYLYKAKVFREIGGFQDLPTVGCEDYQISTKLVLAGFRIESIPLALYDYRFSAHNMAKGISNERAYYSHLRISSTVGPKFSSPRVAFDLAAMSFNAHTQKRGESYWRLPGRRDFKDPRADAPIWRQGEAAVRLAAAFSLYGAREFATAVAAFALANADAAPSLTPDAKTTLIGYIPASR